MHPRFVLALVLFVLLPACAQDDPVGPVQAAASDFVIQGKPAAATVYEAVKSHDYLHWTEANAKVTSTWRHKGKTGWHLATIASAAENTLVQAAASRIAGTQCWIGLSYAGISGDFQWGTGESYSFANWASGNPDNLGASYVTMNTSNGLWYDWDGTTVTSCYLIEWNPAT